MNIALAQSEISHFLECGMQSVPVLWAQDRLRRSVFVDHRYNPELSHSSVFDVLEHYLLEEVLSADDNASELDAWLTAIDEFVEQANWINKPLEDMALALIEIYLDFSGRPCSPEDQAIRATKSLTAYFVLLNFIEHDAELHAAASRQG